MAEQQQAQRQVQEQLRPHCHHLGMQGVGNKRHHSTQLVVVRNSVGSLEVHHKEDTHLTELLHLHM